MRARVRFIDGKIACCSQVCDETCPHYAGCPEFELIIREARPKAEWEEIGLGMYELKKEPKMTTQLQATPVLYGEDAKDVLEQIKRKPTKNKKQKEKASQMKAFIATIKKREYEK